MGCGASAPVISSSSTSAPSAVPIQKTPASSTLQGGGAAKGADGLLAEPKLAAAPLSEVDEKPGAMGSGGDGMIKPSAGGMGTGQGLARSEEDLLRMAKSESDKEMRKSRSSGGSTGSGDGGFRKSRSMGSKEAEAARAAGEAREAAAREAEWDEDDDRKGPPSNHSRFVWSQTFRGQLFAFGLECPNVLQSTRR